MSDESEEEAERLAEARADALFQARLEDAERRARAARMEEADAERTRRDEIRSAMDLLERSDPRLVAEERAYRAVRGVSLMRDLKPPPGPSAAGLTPGQMEEIERKQRSAEMAWEAEQAVRQRWVASQEEAIRDLTAGQSPDSVRAIEVQFRAMKS